MSEPLKGKINIGIRDSVPDWTPFQLPQAPDGAVIDDYPGQRPYRFTGGTIRRVTIDVSGEPCADLEREAAAMLARE